MAANALINDSRLCSQNGRVMRPREEAIRAIQMIIIIIRVCKRFFPSDNFGDVFYIMKNGRLVANGERDAVMTEDILSSVYETSVKTELTSSRLRIHTF